VQDAVALALGEGMADSLEVWDRATEVRPRGAFDEVNRGSADTGCTWSRVEERQPDSAANTWVVLVHDGQARVADQVVRM
jgi:hypothetical protein